MKGAAASVAAGVLIAELLASGLRILACTAGPAAAATLQCQSAPGMALDLAWKVGALLQLQRAHDFPPRQSRPVVPLPGPAQ